MLDLNDGLEKDFHRFTSVDWLSLLPSRCVAPLAIVLLIPYRIRGSNRGPSASNWALYVSDWL